MYISAAGVSKGGSTQYIAPLVSSVHNFKVVVSGPVDKKLLDDSILTPLSRAPRVHVPRAGGVSMQQHETALNSHTSTFESY
jgi:hypothetical protein